MQKKPDIILVGIAIPSLNGIEAVRRLRKLLPAARIIFVTQSSNAPYVAWPEYAPRL